MEGLFRGYRRSSKRVDNSSYTDVTKPCERKDEINGCFQEPYSLKLFKIEVIVSKLPPPKGCELLGDGSSRTDL